MKDSTVYRLFFCGLLLLLSFSGFAWNALGHMVVADIAYQRLHPDVRKKVDDLVMYFHNEYPEMKSYLDLSYWPDTLKKQNIRLFTHWHYIDYPISLDNTNSKKNIDTDNAIWAFNHITDIIKSNNVNRYDQARFFSFFIHVVADLHQPLHTVSLFSTNHPDGDQGGNQYRVWYKNKHTNLHAVWDKGVGLFAGHYSHQRAGQLAHVIMVKYPASFFGARINNFNPSEWAGEGKQYAQYNVYDVPENGKINFHYEEKSRKLVEQVVALSGYRLANLLNHLLQ